ncbi:MAG: hypothetical protein ABSC51_01175 [Gaiellaceae bacterium]
MKEVRETMAKSGSKGETPIEPKPIRNYGETPVSPRIRVVEERGETPVPPPVRKRTQK